MTNKIAITSTFPNTEMISQIKCFYSLSFLLFTFVTKNKLALEKTVTKSKYYRSASNKFKYRFFIAVSLMFNNATYNVENYSVGCEEKA